MVVCQGDGGGPGFASLPQFHHAVAHYCSNTYRRTPAPPAPAQDKYHLYFLFDLMSGGDLMDVLVAEAKVGAAGRARQRSFCVSRALLPLAGSGCMAALAFRACRGEVSSGDGIANQPALLLPCALCRSSASGWPRARCSAAALRPRCAGPGEGRRRQAGPGAEGGWLGNDRAARGGKKEWSNHASESSLAQGGPRKITLSFQLGFPYLVV